MKGKLMRVLKILILAAGCMAAAQAVSAFQKAGAAQPVKRGAAERHYERGQRALDNQRWEEAVAAFTAAQRRGIESKFLYFPDENHWVLKPQNSLLWHNTVNDWLRAHIGQ